MMGRCALYAGDKVVLISFELEVLVKAILAILAAALMVFGCADKTNSKNPTDADPPQAQEKQKKVQPGDSLKFTCADSFNKTTIQIVANWKDLASQWEVSIAEYDTSGTQVFSAKDLVGKPDAVEELHMNISDASALYAKVIQSGEAQALYGDGKRTLNCKFE